MGTGENVGCNVGENVGSQGSQRTEIPVTPEGIIFQTTFDQDGAFDVDHSLGTNTAPEGFDSTRCSHGGIVGKPGEGVGGTVGMKFNWDAKDGENNATHLHKHLTGSATTGYDEIYIRYKVKLPDTFRLGHEASQPMFWKWLRVWQNTAIPNPPSIYLPTEQRADSYYIVTNFGGPRYLWGGVRPAIVMSENINTNNLGSAGGPRVNAQYDDANESGKPASYFIDKSGYFMAMGGGDWEYEYTNMSLANTPQTWHTIEWHFKYSTDDNSNDGEFNLWFDGVEQVPPTNVDNPDQSIDQAMTPNTLLTAGSQAPGKSGANCVVIMDGNWGFANQWDLFEGGILFNDIVISEQRIGHDYEAQDHTP